MIGKHLGTFNLFRESDGSLWITCAEANGVREEISGSGAPPLHLCAMNALYSAADAMRRRTASVDRSGEADKTGTGLAEGESAAPKADAQTPPEAS